jgi:hypothetical protein
MRRIAILITPILLAGCALPPALHLASLAADGVSFIATGKSTTDHALSAVSSEDCAMLRALKEEAICVPESKVVERQVAVSMAGVKPLAKGLSEPEDFDLQEED